MVCATKKTWDYGDWNVLLKKNLGTSRLCVHYFISVFLSVSVHILGKSHHDESLQEDN